MREDVFTALNHIYKPLCDTAVNIKDRLGKLGFCVKNGFYNNHYVKRNDDYCVEYYPIPIISIENIGDIGIDISSIWLEIVLPREKAVLLDYSGMEQTYKFEVYGAENYLCDFCNAESDPRLVVERINSSDEAQICICFECRQESNVDELISIVGMFAQYV